jgi:acyl-CoA thioester hydrolase
MVRTLMPLYVCGNPLAESVAIRHRNCMAKKDFAFRYPFRVRWSETDAQGVVFNARYLDYSDVAVTEYWRACGLRLVNPDEPLEFHVKKATVLWNAPIFPDEMIEVMCRTTKLGRTSITKIVEIHGATEDGSDDLRAEVELVSVFVDLETHRPMPFPDWIRDVFLKFDAGAENAPQPEEVPAQ